VIRKTCAFGQVLLVAFCGVFGSISTARGDDPKEKDSVDSLAKIFLDSSAKRETREQALDLALGLARNKAKPRHAAELRPALITLLSDQLKAKVKDPAFERFIFLGFKCMGVYDPTDTEIAKLAHPYLAQDCPDQIKFEAVHGLETFGTAGNLKELLALLDSWLKPAGTPLPGWPQAEHADDLPRLLAEVAKCDQTPTAEALTLLGALVKQTVFPGARHEACEALGEFVTHRPVKEVRREDFAAALLDVCSIDERDQKLAIYAAEALWRFGNPEGFNKLVPRLDDKRKSTREVYTSVCGAVHVPKGFNNVPPGRFAQSDPATRNLAIAQLKQAWLTASTKSPDDVLLDGLAAAGVNVPKDRSKENKEVITALIEGLALDARDLRYGSLDLLARRTPRKDAVRLFKTLREVSGPATATLTVTQEEPAGGFQSPAMTAKLRAEQVERVKEWRSWWQTFSVNATLVDGVWTSKK
jgi:hypothetical protein